MSFRPRGGPTSIHSDSGEAYSAPHWLDADGDGTIAPSNSCAPTVPEEARDRAFPMVYTRGECPLVDVVFKVEPVFSRTCARIRGSGTNGLSFAATADIVEGRLESGWMASANPLPTTMAFLNPLEITWEVSLDAGSSWIPTGISRNRLYVTHGPARGTESTDDRIIETVIDLACRRTAGLADAQAIMDAIWSDFDDPEPVPEVRRKAKDGYLWPDNAVMRFWAERNDTATLELVDGRDSIGDLLDPCAAAAVNGRGTCRAWTALLEACLAAAGVDGAPWGTFEITSTVPASTGADGGAGVMIKNWTFTPIGTFECLTRSDLTHQVSGTSEVSTAAGVPGQSVTSPLSAFDNHYVLKVGDAVLDPSYGTRWADEAAWEAGSLDGHAGRCVLPPMGAMRDPAGRDTRFELVLP